MTRSLPAVLAALALCVAGPAQLATASTTGTDGPAAGEVVMVVAVKAELTPAENDIRARLRAGGFTVTLRDDSAVRPRHLRGAAFGLLSSTIASVGLGDKLAGVRVPLWIAKPYLFDDYGMTGPTAGVDYEVKQTSTVRITEPGHPMAAGYRGDVVIQDRSKRLSWGKPARSATVIATAGRDPTIFTIARRARLANGERAAGCRLTFPLYENAPTTFTRNGWTLFDATADWAANGCA